MRLFFYTFLPIILASCATHINYKDPDHLVELPPVKFKKSITVLFYEELTSDVYWTGTRLAGKEDYETNDLITILNDSGYFSKVQIHTIPKSILENTKNEVFKNYIKENAFLEESELQLNIRSIGYAGHTHILLPYMAWALVHLGSLGLIPLGFWDSAEVAGNIVDNLGNEIYSFHKNCTSTRWSWSPLIFSKKLIVPSDAMKNFERNCIKSILADAVTTGAFK